MEFCFSWCQYQLCSLKIESAELISPDPSFSSYSMNNSFSMGKMKKSKSGKHLFIFAYALL